jgi:hypothetical protein
MTGFSKDVREWRDIPGYEGFYQVSNDGEVRSLDRMIGYRGGGTAWRRGNALKKSTQHSGHLRVYLHRDGNLEPILVHRLVLLAFVGPCPDGKMACHNDGNPSNNRVENLRWDTSTANAQDRLRHGNHEQANKTHCKRGHPFSPENTLITARQRICRTCNRERLRRGRALKKEEAK